MDELLNHAPCGFVSFADDGTIVAINATLLDMLGYAHDELKNKKLEQILTISSRIFYQTHFFPLITLQGKAEEIFLSLRAKNKENIPVLANAVRREEAKGYLNHCIFVPVHQRKMYEEEILRARRAAEEALRSNEVLAQAKRELEERTQELDRKISRLEQKNREHLRVSQILFHDLWEPLRKIFTFMDLLVQEHQDTLTPTKRLLLDKIRASCLRMEELLRALQQYVSVDSADEVLEQVDLNEVIATAERAMTRDGEPCEVKTETLPVIEGYPRQLVMLFSQLIDNSIKFREPNSTATIRIRNSIVQQNSFRVNKDKFRYIDFVKVVYEDNSVGFDNEYSSSLFDLLKKLNLKSAGLGIGLAICKKVVENHYGSIAAQSESGKGVTFTIFLPIHQQSISLIST